jgi:hypothetical protein
VQVIAHCAWAGKEPSKRMLALNREVRKVFMEIKEKGTSKDVLIPCVM